MHGSKRALPALLVVTLVAIGVGFVVGNYFATGNPALAAGSEAPSPVKAATNRAAYFPQTEDLGPDEMRIISLGTAMPFQRPAQAAPSFLVELGNGDKFLFDIGTGSAERLSALQIPYDYLDKVFLGHLHADHMGDLAALWVGGTINNRTVPLRIWGPNT